MKEQLIEFSTAKLAKEKGFDAPSRVGYVPSGETASFCFNEIRKNSTLNRDNHERNDFVCTAPTQSLLQKWLREVHGTDIIIHHHRDEIKHYYQVYVQTNIGGYSSALKCKDNPSHSPTCFSTYEEALEKGLQEALNLVKTH